MKKNDLLKKPIILSLLLLPIMVCVSLMFEAIFDIFKIHNSIVFGATAFTITAFILGLIYAKLSKECLSKNQKIRISLYFLIFIIAIFLLLSTIFMDLLHKAPAILIADLIIIFLSFINIFIDICCIYVALGLGCKIANPNKAENIEKTKLQDCLLIVLCIVLVMFYDRVNNLIIYSLTTPVMKHFGYVRKPPRIKPAPVIPMHFEDKTSISGIDFVETDNYANPQLGYYYYIPKKLKNAKKVSFLVMVPGLSGKGESIASKPFKALAQKNNFVIIAPSFMEDAENWDSEKSYQYPAAWSGKAFNKILSDFSSKQHISYNELYLFGISAGAQFAERYSLIYPNTVKACYLWAPGGVTLPIIKQKTKFIISVGNKDEVFRKQVAADFYRKAKDLGINVKYKEYNVGHKISDEQIRDSILFFKKCKNHK